MPYKFNPFTGTFDDSTPGATGAQGPAGVVAAANSGTALLPGITFATDLNTGIYNPAADTLAFTVGGAEAARFNSSGRLGIGASPLYPLHIEKAQEDLLALVYAGVVTYRIQVKSDASFAILQNATERLRVDPAGRVLIGLTSGSNQLQLSTDSAGKPSTNTWTIVSDERIKEDIELADLDLCYQAVKTIPLKRYKWREDVYTDEQVSDRRKLGWIAQDVETVYPKAVNVNEFRYNQVYEEIVIPAIEEELDSDGNVVVPAQPEQVNRVLVSEDIIEDCKDLNADQIYAAMYGAIQKLIVKVEALESEVAQLKG
jgi:hypothetical protein